MSRKFIVNVIFYTTFHICTDPIVIPLIIEQHHYYHNDNGNEVNSYARLFAGKEQTIIGE